MSYFKSIVQLRQVGTYFVPVLVGYTYRGKRCMYRRFLKKKEKKEKEVEKETN